MTTSFVFNRRAARACLLVALMLSTLCAFAQGTRGGILDLTGVYEAVPDTTTIPGGLRNSGSPEEISVLPDAAGKAKTQDLALDNAKGCQSIGPFRMMARPGLIDVLPSLKTKRVFILFQDWFLGNRRRIMLDREHNPKTPSWPNGESVGRWDKDTLVVDTTNFDEWIWLNANGVQHSKELRLTERIRTVAGGEYLELKMTADDPKVLTRPYTYTRYFKRTNKEIPQYVCEDDLAQPEIPNVQ